MHDAVRTDNIAQLAALVRDKADIEELDDTGLTPLMIAVLDGNRELSSFLLERGANPNGRSSRRMTPLHAAAHMGRLEIAKLLIDAGAAIDDQQNRERVSPLHLASERGHADIVALLIEKGAKVEAKAADGKNPLTMATLKNHPNVIRILRLHGSDCTKIRLEKFRAACLEAGN